MAHFFGFFNWHRARTLARRTRKSAPCRETAARFPRVSSSRAILPGITEVGHEHQAHDQPPDWQMEIRRFHRPVVRRGRGEQ